MLRLIKQVKKILCIALNVFSIGMFHLIKYSNIIVCLICSIFSVVWYFCPAKSILFKYIDNNYIKIIVTFLVPILAIVITKLPILKSSRDEHDQTLSALCDLVSAVAIFINMNIITYSISYSFFKNSLSNIVNCTYTLYYIFLIMYFVHISIKKLVKITYPQVITIILLTMILGRFNFKEISILTGLSIVLDILLSLDNRKNLSLFLEKNKIGNKFIPKQNLKDELTEDELRGKFIAQKIIIYLAITMILIVIMITENSDFTLYIYAMIQKKGLNSYPILIKYLYKGLDRILLLILAFSILFVKIDIISILKKIFNIEIK